MRSRRRKGARGASAATLAGRIGCGVDVVELSRFRQALSRGGARFMARVFTAEEARAARRRGRMRMLHLAGRFAAKEAILKAIWQVQPARALTMQHIEVRNDRLGRPHARLLGRGGKRLRIHVSISHVDTVAVASAIAIR